MTYPGGKSGAGVYQRLICQIPPHRVYLEPFAGGAAVLRHKRPAPCSIVADRDASVVARVANLAIPGVRALNRCGLELLRTYRWEGGEFVYCDPPYLMDVRSSRRNYYAHEFATTAEHEGLLRTLLTLPCPVMISGYWSELYAAYLGNWRTMTYQAITRGGTFATEWAWMNYPEPLELHDYRHLGRDYRERERIKRKKARWSRKLRNMPRLERYAVLAALQEVSRNAAAGGAAG
jgi:DNA adenine methylase